MSLVWKMSSPTKKLSTAMKMLAKKAVQNPDTLKPDTSDDTRSIISALITSRNKPKVKIVSGMVSKMTTGLMIALAKPSRSADINSDCLSENEMPWNMKPATHSDSAVIPQCARNSIMLFVMCWLCSKGVLRIPGICRAAHGTADVALLDCQPASQKDVIGDLRSGQVPGLPESGKA